MDTFCHLEVFDLSLYVLRHALQCRQAKLSFPCVYLMVGVFSDELCQLHGSPAMVPHVERCEVVRHCRWVDEVITDAPWTVNAEELDLRRIDYVAIDEGTSVDPSCDKMRLGAYDTIKALGKGRSHPDLPCTEYIIFSGKMIPTRRTRGISATFSVPMAPIQSPLPSSM